MTGKIGSFDVGALSIQTDDLGTDIESTNFSVLRLRRDVLARSNIGVLLQNRSESAVADGSNQAYGVDGSFAFFENLSLLASYAKTRTEGFDGNDESYQAGFGYSGDTWGGEVGHLLVGDDFNPEVGFVRREGFRQSRATARFSPRPESIDWIRQITLQGELGYLENERIGFVESRARQGQFRIEFENSDQFTIQFTDSYENLREPERISGAQVPADRYAFQDLEIGYSFGLQRPYSGNFTFLRGDYFGGERTSLGFTRARIEILPQLSVEPSVEFNWIDLPVLQEFEGQYNQHVGRTRVSYSLSPRMYVSGLVQYNAGSDRFSNNFRLRWEWAPGSELFIVYTEDRDTDVLDRWSGLVNRGFVIKVNRLLRFSPGRWPAPHGRENSVEEVRSPVFAPAIGPPGITGDDPWPPGAPHGAVEIRTGRRSAFDGRIWSDSGGEAVPGILKRAPLLLAWAACLRIVSPPPLVAQSAERVFTPVSAEVLNRPAADDWPQYRRTHDNWAHSPLDQIDRGNVELLQLAWPRAIQPGPMEMTPLVYMGVMYLVHPSSRVEAVDATTGDLLWAYERTLPEGVSPTGAMRNLALYGDMVYYSSRDGYLVALRARTGEVVWERFMGAGEFATNYTSGPIAANDVIVTGRSCGLFGGVNNSPGGCYVLAHDAEYGEELWRVNTIARPGEPGGDTWGDLPITERYHVSPWNVSSFDPVLNLIYIGTGVPGPYPSIAQGRGADDALYSNSTLAIDADTGELVCYYQHLPGDDWDLDHIGERILIDTAVDPGPDVPWAAPGIDPAEVRRVVWTAGKGGVQFVLDRTNGEFLWAAPILHQNSVVNISPDGRVEPNAELRHTEVGQTVIIGQRAAKG